MNDEDILPLSNTLIADIWGDAIVLNPLQGTLQVTRTSICLHGTILYRLNAIVHGVGVQAEVLHDVVAVKSTRQQTRTIMVSHRQVRAKQQARQYGNQHGNPFLDWRDVDPNHLEGQ